MAEENYETFTKEEFVRKYEDPMIPVSMSNSVGSWPAADAETGWTFDRLVDRFGECMWLETVVVTSLTTAVADREPGLEIQRYAP